MAKNILMNGETYSGVVDVELPTSGGTAVFRDVDEIPEAPSDFFMVVGGENSTTSPLRLVQVGTKCPNFLYFWLDQGVKVEITLDDACTELCDFSKWGYHNLNKLVSNNGFVNVTTVPWGCFKQCTGLTDPISLPSVESTAGAMFMQASKIPSIELASCKNISSNDFYGCTALTSLTIGSVGHAVETIAATDTFTGATAANLTITIYTTGDKVDGFESTVRATNTTATIVFKAAEGTIYSGTGFASGATIKTCPPA